MDEPPTPTVFSIPASSPYKFEYDSVLVSLWDSVTQDNLIPPGTEYTAPASPLFGDLNNDGTVDADDFNLVLVPSFGRCDGEPEFDPDADLDGDDCVSWIDYQLWHQSFQNPGVAITVYVEGLVASTALGDVLIDLLINPENDGTFTLQDTRAVTVVSVGITPSAGTLGTPLQITMQPAIAPLKFDVLTTAQWDGVFQPTVGDPSDPFTVSFSADQVHEEAAGQAGLLFGDGSLVGSPPPLDDLPTVPGSLDGELTLAFGSGVLEVRRSFEFSPSVTFRLLELVYHYNHPHLTPTFGDELEDVLVSWILDPLDPPFLPGVMIAHFAIEVCVEDNTYTQALAPASITVEAATFDATGTLLDSADNVPLYLSEEVLPGCMLYRSDPDTPFIVISEMIDETLFPELIILHGSDAGTFLVLPGGLQ